MDAFKYSDPVGEGAVSANGDWPTVRVNFPIIRFAEMLLFRAEAYLMTGQADKATADINRIRRYEDRANPESAFTIIGYEDYTNKNAYQAHMMVFPYPSEEITKSNGQLKQNEGY